MSSLNVKYEIKDTFETRCWLPRRCFLTGKSLFMKKAVRATRYLESYRSPMNNQIKQHFWVDRDQYLLNQLKGK